MSEPSASTGDETGRNRGPATGRDGVPEVRLGEDADGCSCLACRRLDATALRRTLLDAARWSVELCGAYPSVPAIAALLVVGRRLLETVAIVPGPLAEFLEGLSAVALFVLLRAYVGIVATEALTGRTASVGERARHVFRRVPALLGLGVAFVGLFLVASSVTTIPLFVALFLVPGNPIGPGTFPLFVAAFTLATVVPILLLLFKVWLAVEACVVGRYGTVDSLRVSWRLTSNVRWRLAVTVLPLLAALGLVYWIGRVPGSDLVPGATSPVVGAVTRSVGELTSVVWYGVYAHLYVQGAVDG